MIGLPRLTLLSCCAVAWSCKQPVFETKDPFSAPQNLLADRSVEGCAVYEQSACESGVQRTCKVYDASAGAFVSPDPLTHRALLYERWYALYHSPDGQHAKRRFAEPIPGDMEEAQWSALDRFSNFDGLGDAAIWSGTALNATILRYLVTGTEADYQRLEARTRQLLMHFEVTGIPGYLARYHFYRAPVGAPKSDQHAVFYDDEELRHTDHEIKNPERIEGLPALYTEGMVDEAGQRWMGTPMWHGVPSIDQYSGLTTSLPAAWGLLRDEALKSKIALHLGCYLKRLQRAELTNIQKNPEAKELAQVFFENSGANFDPEDIDLTKLDTLVMYYLPQPNSANADTFDSSCPDSITTSPTRIIDATAPDFGAQMLGLVGDITGAKKSLSATNIDHYYLVNARGADAVHMMGLAAMSYHFTGEALYKDFLENELITNLQTLEVADTYSAVIPPKWCRKWYASHISIGPLWGLLNLLEDSVLRDRLYTVMHEEAWNKDGAHLGNAKFALMFAGSVPSNKGDGQDAARDEAVALLEQFGGNGGVLDAPRRTYYLPYDEVEAQLPGLGIEAECPSEDVVRFCEEGQTAFGVAVNPFDITEPCVGEAYECPTYNGECARKRASSALPVQLRQMWGFQWQGDPYRLGDDQGRDPSQSGVIQSSGIDLIESYWMARYYGFINEGQDYVLAWSDDGACE